MTSLLVLLLLSSLSFGSERRAATQPAAALRVRLGENFTLPCPLLVGPSSTLSWYRKSGGQSPQLLVSFRPRDVSKVTYGFGVHPDKVVVGGDGSMLLRNTEESDSAFYYCGVTEEEKEEETPGS
ncbi:hypothetical protein LDENG_00197790 [Lucifuga dentata]|nr:hypothetical protein LDENG_00197790 [Lucifuga dentata]